MLKKQCTLFAVQSSGLVKRARKKGPNGEAEGDEVIIKMIIKVRFLTLRPHSFLCYKSRTHHPFAGITPLADLLATYSGGLVEKVGF